MFLFYQLVTVIRGFFLSNDGLIQIFREPHNFLGFIIPLLVFVDKNKYNIMNLFKTLYFLGILFLLIGICFPNLLLSRLYSETITSTFAIGCGFLLMNAKYFTNIKINISFSIILISALSLTYLARRSAAFTFFAILLSSYLLNILNNSNKTVFKIFPLIISAGFFLAFFPNNFSSKLTERLSERLYEDSRTILFAAFFDEMDEFMIFGKGMNGTYYYPMDETEMEDGIIFREVVYRNVIENGYLQTYLTGGIINIVLFILLLLPASLLGIFRSYNQFTIGCGVMIFLWLIDMLLYGLPVLSIHYVIIWICVGICYKKTFRNKTDSQIRAEFFILAMNLIKFNLSTMLNKLFLAN